MNSKQTFSDKDGLIKPILLFLMLSRKNMKKILVEDEPTPIISCSTTYGKKVKNIPAMFNAYIGLTDTMRFRIIKDDFGSVYGDYGRDGRLETKNNAHQPYVGHLRKMMDERAARTAAAK